MTVAYHAILSAYGFWLPNDPRGSWSVFCAAWELFRYGGKATKIEIRKSVARAKHDRAKRLAIKKHLKHAPIRWNGLQALARSMNPVTASSRARFLKTTCTSSSSAATARSVRSSRTSKAIEYVDRNPAKERKKRQDWNFVREAREAREAHTDARRKRRG